MDEGDDESVLLPYLLWPLLNEFFSDDKKED